MSLSAALVLAAATLASVQPAEAHRGVVLAEARVSATILASAAVRQASGPVWSGNGDRPQHQVRRDGRRVLLEFQ